MGLLPLYNVLETKSLKAAPSGGYAGDKFDVPDFAQGEAVTIDYIALTRNLTGGFSSPWTKIGVGAYSLCIGLFTAAGTQLALVTAFTDNGITNTKTGTLIQDSAAITTALAGGTSVPVVFEIEYTDAAGNKFKSYQKTVNLTKGYITAANVTAPVGQVAATQDWVRSLFVAKEAATGDVQVLRDDLGNRYLMYPDEDGFVHADKL